VSSTPTATRVRSGLSANLPDGWSAIDAIELRGPNGMGLSVASYPVDGRAGLAALTSLDHVPGAEPVGALRPAQLLGSDAGMVQRFDASGDQGFTQLAGYVLRADRLIVVRATCRRDQFDVREREMQALMSSAAIDVAAARRTPQRHRSDAFSSVLEAFLAGATVCELPERPVSQGAAALVGGWTASSRTRAEPLASVPMLTAPELHAVAQLYGQVAFPGVRRSASADADVEAFGRAALMARGLVRFDSPDAIEVEQSIRDVATLAFHAEMVIDVVLSGRRQRRATYFLGPESTLGITGYPGGVHSCRTIATGDAFGDLLALIGELADTGDGAVSTDELDITAPDRDEVVIRAASVDGDRVDVDTVRLVSIPGAGCEVWFS